MEIVALALCLCWLVKQLFQRRPMSPGFRGAVCGRGRELSIRKSPLNYLVLSFIGLIIIQCLPWPAWWVKAVSPGTFGLYRQAWGKVPAFITLSIYPYGSRIGLFQILAYAGVFFLIVNWADTKERIKALAGSFVLIGSIEAIYGILMYLGKYHRIFWYEKIWYRDSVTGTYINRNHLAGLLEMAIPIAFGLLVAMSSGRGEGDPRRRGGRPGGIRGFLLSLNIDDHEQARKTLLIFLMAIMTLALMLSGSRGGILSLAAAFIVMSTLLFFRGRRRKYSLAGLAIVLIALGYGLMTGLNTTIKRFEKMNSDAQTRIRFARTSLNIVKDFPLLGTGWGTFGEAYRRYQGPEDNCLVIDHAHHDWVELGAETGFAGLGLVVFSLLFCLGYFLSLWKSRKNSVSFGIGLGGMGAIISLALHSLTDFNMHIPANALLFGMVVGITQSALTCQRHGRGKGLAPQEQQRIQQNPERMTLHLPDWLCWPLAVLGAAGFGLAVALVWKPYQAEKALPTLPDSTRGKSKEPALEEVCKAISCEPANAEYFYRLALLLEKKEADQHSDQQHSDQQQSNQQQSNEQQGDQQQSDRQHHDGQQEEYDRAMVDSVLAQLKADAAKRGESGDDLIFAALRKAISLNPANPHYHVNMAWQKVRPEKLIHEDQRTLLSSFAEAEEGFGRAVYFMPQSAQINLSVGSYWLWKSKVVEDETAYLHAFDQFIRYFRTASRINPDYKRQIRQMVRQYYPVDDILARIFPK